ncbi:MAG: DUF4838 domain-containing protein [Kiritimatiellae bacterium]|nr:DUF4838 domain-containing protein [Kiritimatiellia bacterium]
MRSASILTLLIFVLALSAAHGKPDPADQMTIAKDGKPLAVIVVPDNAGRTEKFAAEELQKYLEKICGARLEIIPENKMVVEKGVGPSSARVFIGKTTAAEQLRNMLKKRDTDAFMVKIERQQIGEFVRPGQWDDRPGTWHDLFLVGAEDRGTLYAVYDFLELELGCRWLAPGELWEEIPRQATIAVPAGARLEEPGMKYRQDNSLVSSDWGLKQKANVSRSLGWSFKWMDVRYRDTEPLPIDVCGWTAVHAAPRILLGVSRENPEWFALDNKGKRVMSQMCFSNPEVHDLLAERLSQLLRERPQLDFVEMGCADGITLNYCRCARCLEWDALGSAQRQGGKRGMHTHRWLAIVNAVAARLAESDPGKKLIAGAYASYQEPPDPAVIKPATNVIVMYWSWDGCRVHGYEHAAEDENRLPEMTQHSKHRQWMEAWIKLTPAGMIMSEYVQRSSMDGIVGTNPRRFVQDMRYLHKKGFIGYNAFDDPIQWGMQTVNRYAVVKAMWNPDIDADALVKDFCDHAFHAASPDMQKFIKTIEDAMRVSGCSHVAATSWIKPEAIAAARGHLDAAHKAAAGDETAAVRLREFEWHFRYSELAGSAIELWFRVVRGDRDPELMREAIRLGEAAIAFRSEMLQKYPDVRFRTAWRMSGYVEKDGSWRNLLAQMEKDRK